MDEKDKSFENDFVPEIPKGQEYKYMCIGLFQGYEINWFNRYANIMVNEFGKPENFDDFLKRHPNFGEDIKKTLLNYETY